jgi:hypothetical protein
MKPNNTLQKLTWKERTFFALACSLVYGTLLFFLSIFFKSFHQELNSIVFQAIFFGLFFGVGFPYVIQKNSKKVGRFLSKKIQPKLEEGEKVEYESPANLFRGVEAVGGKLFLTNQKLIFKSHKFNFQNGQIQIQYNAIVEISLRKTSKIVNNGLRITTNKNEKFDLVLNDRKKWMAELKTKINKK